LMQEGTRGLAFYVLAEGECSMFKQSMESCGRSVSLWEVFGDVDLFYHSPRVWSCKCVRQGAVWFVTREEFGAVVKQHDNYSRKREVFNFLKSIPTFQKIDRPQLKQIVQSSKLQHFGQGDYVINQGSLVSFVYVIKEGEVSVTRYRNHIFINKHVLRKGQWFGSVTGLQRHQNNVIAAGINSFMTSSNDGVTDVNVGASLVRRVLDPDGSGSEITKSSSGRLAGINLEDFNVVATIGNGAFGSVDLVALASDNTTAFAVKKMSNDNITSADPQHVTNEMKIQSMTSQECPFIVSLYTTFKDNRNIYFVMEFCPGGELFTLLTSAKSFDLNASRFYTACVVEALSFLHSGGVVFRDLKPENLVLDRQGYCKLTDFGFAKKLSNRSHLKTYTFCGTPECMAPEILLYQAHSFPVDLWALGVFIFELVVGKAPFRNKNKDELGQSILRGIEPKLKVTNRIDDVTMNIVEQLCQLRANERLGAGGKGLNEVTNHPWFNGFKWELLRQRKLVAPWRPSINSSTDVRYFHSCTKHQSPIKGNFPGFDASF
uniref:cGMP-dependent protein kinase n=1 Tax=Ciona savignyi TaxID=51511 RepID=H2YN13_CIOSA